MGIAMSGLTKFFSGLFGTIGVWGSWIVGIVGAVMVIVGIYQIGKGFMSGGKGQTNWAMAILCLVIGGILAGSGGWGAVTALTNQAAQSGNVMASGGIDGTARTADLGGAGGGGGTTTIVVLPNFE